MVVAWFKTQPHADIGNGGRGKSEKHLSANCFKLAVFAKIMCLLLTEKVMKMLTFHEIEKSKNINYTPHYKFGISDR